MIFYEKRIGGEKMKPLFFRLFTLAVLCLFCNHIEAPPFKVQSLQGIQNAYIAIDFQGKVTATYKGKKYRLDKINIRDGTPCTIEFFGTDVSDDSLRASVSRYLASFFFSNEPLQFHTANIEQSLAEIKNTIDPDLQPDETLFLHSHDGTKESIVLNSADKTSWRTIDNTKCFNTIKDLSERCKVNFNEDTKKLTTLFRQYPHYVAGTVTGLTALAAISFYKTMPTRK
jgi:hypothetical protein